MGSALNAGLLCLWAGLLGYVCVLAPNQTPTIDAFVVQKLVGCVRICTLWLGARAAPILHPYHRSCKATTAGCTNDITWMLPCRLKAEDPFQVNEVFTCVWNFMGLYPLIYAALLIPAARSNRVRSLSCSLALPVTGPPALGRACALQRAPLQHCSPTAAASSACRLNYLAPL
jgi:hypothetical protein